MRCSAFVDAFELIITLPHHMAILAGAVPDFWPKETSAVATNQAARKDAFTTVSSAQCSPSSNLNLYLVKQIGVDDCFMTLFNVVLRDFTLIYFRFFLKEVYVILLRDFFI